MSQSLMPAGASFHNLSEAHYRKFFRRVADDLKREPLDVGHEAHRTEIAVTLARLGEQTFYELLEVGSSPDEQEVHDQYLAIARQVHPSHAKQLGLGDREGVLRVLFERATLAYLVLSDPQRRSAYAEAVGDPDSGLGFDRDEEKRRIAQHLVARARRFSEDEEGHFAVELLRQAVRLEPKAETWASLARAQAMNPKWVQQAVDSMRNAVKLSPTNVEYQLALGELWQQHREPGEARQVYERILERIPNQAEATDALEALRREDKAAKKKKKRGWFS